MSENPASGNQSGKCTHLDRTGPGVPVFTFRLGAVDGARPPSQDVASVVAAAAPSFSLVPCEGFFRGRSDPGWAITVALDELGAVAALAENLRVRFAQDGVGVEAYGRYLRCHAGCCAEELLAQLWGLAHGFFPAYFQTCFTMPAVLKPWPERFAIITAWATTGEQWTAGRNEAADENLRLLLIERGLEHHRITGGSPDGKHAEPGWLVVTALDEAIKIGRSFLQDAIYWVDDDRLSVFSCVDGRAAKVDLFSSRIRSNVDET